MARLKTKIGVNRNRGMSQGSEMKKATEQLCHREIDRGKEERKGHWSGKDGG